jgi:hypothetical protein
MFGVPRLPRIASTATSTRPRATILERGDAFVVAHDASLSPRWQLKAQPTGLTEIPRTVRLT